MNKILIPAAALCLVLGACNSNSDEPTSTITTAVKAYNHITARDGSVSTSYGAYEFTLQQPGNMMSVAGTNLAFPGNLRVSFKTDPAASTPVWIQYEGQGGEQIDFGPTHAGGVFNITNLEGTLTSAVYAPGVAAVPGYPRLVPDVATGHWACLSYSVDSEFSVKTFWPDMTYCGETVTTMPGAGESQSGAVRYRVIMQRDANDSLNGKADVIMYNASFAPGMPEITIVLKDMQLDFNERGFIITGADLVPSMLDGGVLLPNPKYVINKFEFTGSGSTTGLTHGEATYQVMGRFGGQFSGNCIAYLKQ